MFIQVFFFKLDMYVIDELFIGFDLILMKCFVDMFKVEKDWGVGIFMCIYVFDIVEKICDWFYMIEKGFLFF